MIFNIQDVSDRAQAALLKNQSNPEESRQIYLEEILDWTDNYTENNLAVVQSTEAKTALNSIVQLWIAYCNMEIGLRQFKQAVKIFEDAISDPVASRSADIYLAYVDYCTTRNKPSNAQKVYIKGLSSQLSQQESDKLWVSFLPFIRAQGSPELTMQQLYEAVTIEAGAIVGGNTLTAPGAALLGGGAETMAGTVIGAQAGTLQQYEEEKNNNEKNVKNLIENNGKEENKEKEEEEQKNDKNEEDQMDVVVVKLEPPSPPSPSPPSTVDINNKTSLPPPTEGGTKPASSSSFIVEDSSSMLVEESCVESESKSDEKTDGQSVLNTSNSASSTNIMIAASSSSEPDSKVDVNGSSDLATAATAATVATITTDTTGTAMDVDNSGMKEEKHVIQDSVVTDASTSSSTPNPNPVGGVGDDLDSVIGLTPEQLTRMYAHRPPMLFSAPSLEPTVFGLSVLTAAETAELESFLGVPLADIQYGPRQNKVDVYLDLVEGLWTAQALKERHFDSWFTDLKKLHEKEGRDLSRACEEKEKEAVGGALDGVKEKNQADRKRFRSRCAVQREVLHAVVNKTIYSLLMDQLRTLTAADFPRFTSGVIERIQGAMAMLKSGGGGGGGVGTTVTPAGGAGGGGLGGGGLGSSSFDQTLLDEISVQRKYLCALLSLRVNLAPPVRNRGAGGAGSGVGTGVGSGGGGGRRGSEEDVRGDTREGMRRSSVGSDYNSGGQNGRSDYYSQDSKLQRKAKRRKVYDGSDEIRFDDRRVRGELPGGGGGGGPGGGGQGGAFEGRRQGPGGGQGHGQQAQGGGGQGGGGGPSVGYQGPEHLRRGPKRVVRGQGQASGGRNPGDGGHNTQQNQNTPKNPKNLKNLNPSGPLSVPSVPFADPKDEPAPINLLQKLATMIQKAKK